MAYIGQRLLRPRVSQVPAWHGVSSGCGVQTPEKPDVQGPTMSLFGSDGHLVCPRCCWFELALSFPSSTGMMLRLLPSLPLHWGSQRELRAEGDGAAEVTAAEDMPGA